MKCIVQRPGSKPSTYFNCIVDADIARVDETWGVLKSFDVLHQYEARLTPPELKSLPVIHKGYCDSHIHSMWMASQENSISFKGLRSCDEIFLEILKFKPNNPADFIQAYDWDHDVLGYSAEDFSKLLLDFCKSQSIELVAFRVCAHMAVITEDLAKHWGLPKHGLLRDAELEKVHERLFRWTVKESAALFERAQTALLAKGITCISEMSVHDGQLDGILSLAQSGKLKIDVQVVLDHEISQGVLKGGPFVEYNISNVGPMGTPAQVQVRHVKRFLDGSLGARTAWLRSPYEDDEVFGDSLYADSDLFGWAERTLKDGWLLSFHAIGDAALEQIYRLTLHCRDLLQKSLQIEYSPFFKLQARHRIEHAQVMGEDQLKSLNAQNIWSFFVQPYHRVADEGFILKRLGPTRFYNESYRLGSFLRFDHPFLAIGSDAPIASHEPRDLLISAQQHPNPLERVDWLTALWHYTTGGRIAMGMHPGVLAPGSTVVISEPV